MRYDWNFERKDGLACDEFLYKAIAEHMGTEYELACLESWSFAFDGEKMQASSNEGDFTENLEKYHGIQIVNTSVEKQNAEMRIRKYVEEGGVCLLWTDLYLVPWEKICYQKRHWNHALAILDVRENGYLCYDYYTTQGEILPFDHLPEEEVIELQTFTRVEPCHRISTYVECERLLQKTLLDKIENQNVFAAMGVFANIFNADFDIYEVTKDADAFENSAFINAVNRLAQCRFQFSIVLEYFDNKFPGKGLSIFAENLKVCAVAWKSITGLLIKAYLVADNRKIIERVKEKIIEERKREERIYYDLYDHLLGKKKVDTKGRRDESTIQKAFVYHPVCLEEYFNHKAYGDDYNSQHGLLEECSFLVLDERAKCRVFSYGLCNIFLGDVERGKSDNIQCNGQRILINEDCKTLVMAYNAEYDHQMDFLIVETEAGEEKLDITVSAWDRTPVLGDDVLWSGRGGVDRNREISFHSVERRIFAKAYEFPKEIYVRAVVLPCNPNIHIFGMSVGVGA